MYEGVREVIRNKILVLDYSMSSSDINDFNGNDFLIRDYFYKILVDRIPTDIVEKIVPYFNKPQIVNIDWGDIYRALKKYSKVISIKKFNTIEEIDKVNGKYFIALIEIKELNNQDELFNKLTEIMNNLCDNYKDGIWGVSRTKEDKVTLLEFD
tara:strand:- start:511 stop:972 length:462 start_codon:yes stop_codon:yes gene_type:complete